MSQKYNIRDNKTGRFAKMSAVRPKIVTGRLSSWKNTVVRASVLATVKSGGKRIIGIHKTLFGFVDDSELKPISKEQVENYLQNS